MKKTNYLVMLALTSVLTACGGSSSSNNDSGDNSGNGGNTGGDNGGNTSTLDTELALWLDDMASDFIIPAYQEFDSASQQLLTSVATCSDSSFGQSQLEQIKSDWQASFSAWQAIQWLKTGPILDDNNRGLRIQFWPDSNDSVKDGVRGLLNSSGALTAESISGITVGSQGLPALELLLYPEQNSDSLVNADNKARRCEAAQAIAGNLANISADLVSAWSENGGNYKQTFTEGTGEFSGQKDAVEEIVSNWLESLEVVKDEKIIHPLSLQKPGIPSIAESPYSDTSLQHIKVNIQSLLDIYTAKNGHGFDDILNTHLEQTSIASQMVEALTQAKEAIDALLGSYTEALNDDAKRAELDKVINALRDVRTVLTADFIQALDLNVGFNSNDGD